MSARNRSIARRQFLKGGIQAAALSAAPLIVPSTVLGQRSGAVPPSDRIVMGGIGIGSRGAYDLQTFLAQKDVQFVAVCDVREERREAVKTAVDRHYGNRDCAMYSSHEELLALNGYYADLYQKQLLEEELESI
jgi:ornithine cyclodeaminase/alanine dehydrogenase-like protein (mu-crystallin family)